MYFQKLVEDYENRLIAQEERITKQSKTIEDNTLSINNRIEELEEVNQALHKEIKELRDNNINETENLPRTEEEKELLQYKLELQRAKEELNCKEFMVG